MPLALHRALLDFVNNHPALVSKRWVVGYSGGRDSHVLLQTLALVQAQFNLKLKAIHVNHQIHLQASQWAQHCQNIAYAFNIECQILNVNLALKKGESIEAKARELRYEAIRNHLEPNDILLTAHTQDDQAETVLLQLIRGAGVQGLSAMGECKALGSTFHYRPLLSITREQIEKASIAYGLSWITDDSNDNVRFDRNFIRHDILPLLKSRFKGVVPSLARSAQLCQEAASAQQVQAQSDFEKIYCEGLEGVDEIKGLELIKLPFERQKAVIRYWIAKNNYLYPSKVKLEDMLRQMNTARLDSTPSITWAGGVVRRYKQNWYLSKQLNQRISFDFRFEKVQGRGFKLALIEDLSQIRVGYRVGGERCKPTGQAFSKSLKKWFQIFEIPIWMREAVPLIYYQDQLIGAVGYFICEGWQVAEREEWGVEIVPHSGQSDSLVIKIN